MGKVVENINFLLLLMKNAITIYKLSQRVSALHCTLRKNARKLASFMSKNKYIQNIICK